MTATANPVSINPADESIQVGPLTIRFLQTGDHSNGSIASFELTVPAGQMLPGPAHSHDAYEETTYGLEGVLTWTVDDQPFNVGPGQSLCIPRGAIHRFDNNTAQTTKCLCIITPAALGPQYFREISQALAETAGGPPNKQKLAEIMLRHGLTPAPPSQPASPV